jgi:hypothetical protein
MSGVAILVGVAFCERWGQLGGENGNQGLPQKTLLPQPRFPPLDSGAFRSDDSRPARRLQGPPRPSESRNSTTLPKARDWRRYAACDLWTLAHQTFCDNHSASTKLGEFLEVQLYNRLYA